MDKCDYCEKEIAPGADECPHCGGKTTTFARKVSIRDWNKATIINFGATLVLFAIILQTPPSKGMLTISIYFVLCFGFFISSLNVNMQLNKLLDKTTKDQEKKFNELERMAKIVNQGAFSVLTSIIAVIVYLYIKEYTYGHFVSIIPPIILMILVFYMIFYLRIKSAEDKITYNWIGFPSFTLIYIIIDYLGLLLIE